MVSFVFSFVAPLWSARQRKNGLSKRDPEAVDSARWGRCSKIESYRPIESAASFSPRVVRGRRCRYFTHRPVSAVLGAAKPVSDASADGAERLSLWKETTRASGGPAVPGGLRWQCPRTSLTVGGLLDPHRRGRGPARPRCGATFAAPVTFADPRLRTEEGTEIDGPASGSRASVRS